MAALAGKSEPDWQPKAEKQVLAIDIGDVICINTRDNRGPKAERQGGTFLSKHPTHHLNQSSLKGRKGIG